jgi:hypothetical protein
MNKLLFRYALSVKNDIIPIKRIVAVIKRRDEK